MLTNHVAPMSRTLTLGFVPPPPVNLPSTMSFTDVDQITGERSTIPLAAAGMSNRDDKIWRALEKLALIELASRLDVDWSNVPAWVPKIDEALDANLKLTEMELHERLLADILEEQAETAAPSYRREPAGISPVPGGSLVHLPSMLTRIGIVLEEVEQNDELRRALIISPDEAQEEIVEKVVECAERPLQGMTSLFGVGHGTVELSHLQMGAHYVRENSSALPIGEIDDIAIATCLAWTTNLLTSAQPPEGERVGLWLCDGENRPLSNTVTIEVRPDGEGVRFQLPLSSSVARSDLRKLNLVLSKLACDWP